MIRTQIYLPEETHSTLLRLAQEKGTTLSRLIREGARAVIKKNYGKLTPEEKALKFFVGYKDKWRIKLTDSAVNLIRKQRE